MRWGVTPNLTLNGTINPDLSTKLSDPDQLDSADVVAFLSRN